MSNYNLEKETIKTFYFPVKDNSLKVVFNSFMYSYTDGGIKSIEFKGNGDYGSIIGEYTINYTKYNVEHELYKNKLTSGENLFPIKEDDVFPIDEFSCAEMFSLNLTFDKKKGYIYNSDISEIYMNVKYVDKISNPDICVASELSWGDSKLVFTNGRISNLELEKKMIDNTIFNPDLKIWSKSDLIYCNASTQYESMNAMKTLKEKLDFVIVKSKVFFSRYIQLSGSNTDILCNLIQYGDLATNFKLILPKYVKVLEIKMNFIDEELSLDFKQDNTNITIDNFDNDTMFNHKPVKICKLNITLECHPRDIVANLDDIKLVYDTIQITDNRKRCHLQKSLNRVKFVDFMKSSALFTDAPEGNGKLPLSKLFKEHPMEMVD